MNIMVKFQTHGGNTKVVAEAIAKAAGITAETIDSPITEPVDLLIVGGGVYAWGIDKSLKGFLENLNPALVKEVAAFTTAGVMDKTNDILAIVRVKGIKTNDNNLAIKFGPKYHATFGGAGKAALSDKQLATINAFVSKMISK